MTIGRKTGGRQKGTRNRISDAHRLAIHRACREIGSGRALVGGSRSDPLTRFYVRAWQAEPATFLSKVLPAVLPPPPREDTELPDATLPAPDSLFDSARRIAFILAAAQHEQEARTVELVELSPPQAPAPDPPAPQPTIDELPEWQDPPPTPPTSDTLETFRGNAAEQGRACDRPEVIDARRKAHDDYVARLASRHRRSLL